MNSPTPAPPVAPAAPDPDPFGLVGATLDGKYRVDAAVAEGGFGVVYRATHASLGTRVAVKVLKVPGGLDDEARAEFLLAFQREAQLIAALDHPGVVRVLDFGASVTRGSLPAPWMVLQWIEGETLEADLDRRAAAGLTGRAPAEALALLRPVVEAVAHAHAAGVAHRDLKPANIMISRGAARVLDFGIAKVMGDEDHHPGVTGCTATRSVVRAFTPDYAAPEQISGARTGPWTDVLALGLLLTQALTDRQPYDGADPTELYASALSDSRPTPARRGVDAGALEAVIAKAVSVRVSERYADAGELLAALDAAAGAAPPVGAEAPAASATPTARRGPMAGASRAIPWVAFVVFVAVPFAVLCARAVWRTGEGSLLPSVVAPPAPEAPAPSVVAPPAPEAPAPSVVAPPVPEAPAPSVVAPPAPEAPAPQTSRRGAQRRRVRRLPTATAAAPPSAGARPPEPPPAQAAPAQPYIPAE